MRKLTDLEKAQLFREQLAALEHARWSHWIRYMVKHPEELDLWLEQASTKYCDLSEKEKDGDREWADKILSVLNLYLSN